MSLIDSYFKIVQLTKDVKALNKIRGKAKEDENNKLSSLQHKNLILLNLHRSKAKEIESKKLTSLQQNVNDGKEGKSAISIETSKLETSK
jgi:hypothetical protein